MNIRFVAGFSPIVDSVDADRDFYGQKLGLPVQFDADSNYTMIDLKGTKQFGL